MKKVKRYTTVPYTKAGENREAIIRETAKTATVVELRKLPPHYPFAIIHDAETGAPAGCAIRGSVGWTVRFIA